MATKPLQLCFILLHGYGLQAERWMSLFTIEADANTAMTGTNAAAKPMIVVNPSAYSRFDGSFYSSSPTAGDWERFIADDLVNYIDSHYRTLPARESRGLGGHCMGGYGTLRIGMKRSDVFSVLYPLSAAGMLETGEPSEALATADWPIQFCRCWANIRSTCSATLRSSLMWAQLTD